MVIEPLSQVRDELRGITSGLDPELLHGHDAAAALGVCAEIERLAAGARILLSERVEATRAWAGTGKRSAADWLADQAGTSVGEAANAIKTGRKLRKLPKVRDAVRKGSLSGRQAEVVVHGAAADPSAQEALLDLAGKASLGELRAEAQRTAAAAEVDEMAAYNRIRRWRFFRHRRDPDGAWVGTLRTTADLGALVLAAINQARTPIFNAARHAGQWSSSEAYDADALVAVAAHFLGVPLPDPPPASPPVPSAVSEHPAGTSVIAATDASTDERAPAAAGQAAPELVPGPEVLAGGRAGRSVGSRTPLVARLDLAALVRGSTRSGERCEITGIGPVPVAVLRSLLPAAFVAAVAVDEAGLPTQVAHLGRGKVAAGAATGRHPPPGQPPPGRSPLGPAPPGPAPPCLDSLRRGLGGQLKIIVAVPERAVIGGPPDAGGRGGDAPARAIAGALRAGGVAVAAMVHHTRPFRAMQRTVLEHRNPQCAVLGCAATARLQLDHRADWAATHTTDADEADRLCDPHHDLKTRFGWRLEPGTGKRRLLPPPQGG
jgi:hypothetical protein